MNWKWQLLNDQYLLVTLFAVQSISNYDLDKILQCDYPRGDFGFQVTGMIEWGQKSKPRKITRASNKPPQNVKFPSLKNFQKALKTWNWIVRNWMTVFVSSSYHLIFTTQLNPGIENFKLQKILRSSLSLEIWSTPAVVTIQANSF